MHITFGIFLFCTIIGIPLSRKHFALIELSLVPFGKTFVTASFTSRI
ncbi:YccF domain-containing protein [Porphyromonas sp. COT-108 OH1349]